MAATTGLNFVPGAMPPSWASPDGVAGASGVLGLGVGVSAWAEAQPAETPRAMAAVMRRTLRRRREDLGRPSTM